jgi:NADH-quinone oxidoreductase subunit A
MYSSLFIQNYSAILIGFVISSVLAVVIFGLSFNLTLQQPDTEKLSPYECGFDPYEDARQAFDVRFYLVSMLFIIFDLEAMFLFPWVCSLSQIGLIGYWAMIDFLVELAIGFVYAWRIDALKWN